MNSVRLQSVFGYYNKILRDSLLVVCAIYRDLMHGTIFER